jgi:dTDP-4-dehydrorhamnose 3,5-epimerase-like enzyme
MSSAYSSKHARGFKFNDKTFAVEWPHDPKVISDKDKSWKNFDKKVDGIEF